MARKATERLSNVHGHQYSWWSTGSVYICGICGTAEHKNGRYWWAGRWSKTEPPCGNSSPAQREWYNSANLDPEWPDSPDMAVEQGG